MFAAPSVHHDEWPQTVGSRRSTFVRARTGVRPCYRSEGAAVGYRISAPLPTGRVADNGRRVPAQRGGGARSRWRGRGSPAGGGQARGAEHASRRGRPAAGSAGARSGRDASLTLVAAPAGYGKTTAARAWCASLDAALAWVTLDAGDNDPVVLWRYVATAVDRVSSGLGRDALRRLSVAGGQVEAAIDELMNGVAALGSELVVVLDDLHEVTDEESLSSIDYAVGHLPANLHLVLLTRVDPALSLARLRAADAAGRGSCSRARVHDRRGARAARGSRSSRARCGGDRHARGADRGLARGLVLAWLWLGTVEDPARAVRAFGGDNRFVADYLSSEVLAALDEEERAFLHGAAVLGEFTAELCDAVLDRSDSAARLAELERSNLFVSRLERGGWFRIHSLFAEYARTQLASVDPGAPTLIHRRAAVWLRSHGLAVEAVRHAAAAGDHELVAELMVEYHLPLIRGGAGPDGAALGSDVAGGPARRASGARGGGRDGGDVGRRAQARAAPVASARRHGPWSASGARRAPTSRPRRGWSARSRSTRA